MVFSKPVNLTDFPLPQYLERIGLKELPKPDEAGLRQTHAAQAFSIPFENLDIHLGRVISLKPEDLVAKLIYGKRGGYCFELNGIYHLALKSLGFSVQPVLARVLYGRSNPGARTHQVLVVTISGRKWLADIGFGGPGLRLPIPMVVDQFEEQCGERYRLRQDPMYGMILQKESRNVIVDLYSFDERELIMDIDIDMANHFTATWPDSIFRLHRMCALPKPWGRITLVDMELCIYCDGQSTTRTLSPGSAYIDAITQNFGISLNVDYNDLAPLGRI